MTPEYIASLYRKDAEERFAKGLYPQGIWVYCKNMELKTLKHTEKCIDVINILAGWGWVDGWTWPDITNGMYMYKFNISKMDPFKKKVWLELKSLSY